MPRPKENNRASRRTVFFGQIYTFFCSLRFAEAFWVIYLRSRGLSFAMIGLMETVFHLASLFGEIPTGWIADRWSRKASLLLGRALSIIAAGLVLLARGPWGLAIAFSLSALGFTCHSGAFDALVYDELSNAGRSASFTRVMGRINAFYLAGASLAALLGGFAARRALSLLYVLGIGADLAAIFFLLPLRELPPARPAGQEKRIDLGRDFRLLAAALRRPGLAGLLLLWGAVSALVTSAWFYGQSLMRAHAIPITLIGFLGMLGNLAAIAPSCLAHRAEKRYGGRRPLYWGSAAVPLLMLLAGAIVPSGAGRLGAAAVAALLLGINILNEGLYPLFNSAVNALAPTELRATVLSSGNMLFSLIMMIVFPAIGIFGDLLGLRFGFVLAGGLAALAGLGVTLALAAQGKK